MSAMLAETRPDEATAVIGAHRPERKRIVIIGGGFAGIAAAHALRHADAEVLLIDRRNHHISQPLLYQVDAGRDHQIIASNLAGARAVEGRLNRAGSIVNAGDLRQDYAGRCNVRAGS